MNLQVETDLAELLRDADDLMRRARLARKAGNLEAAEQALDEAADRLARELQEREAHLRPSANRIAASEDRRALAVRLADCYGPLGGIARRHGDYRRALDCYAKGRELELNETYDIASTYNRVQWIVLQIVLEPASVSSSDGRLRNEARALLQLLARGTANDAWTNADALLLSVILNDRRGARDAWNALVNARPIRDVYESGLPVLRELAAALPANDLLRDTIAKYQSRLAPDAAGRE